MAANAQIKPADLGCESEENWQLPSASTVAIIIITQPTSWYSFYRPTRVEGWVDLGTAEKMCSPCPRLYIAAAAVIDTAVHGVIRTWVLSHSSQKH